MPRCLTHEALAVGRHCTATGVYSPWKAHLTNNESLLEFVVTRMEKDYEATLPKQRRPWTVKELDSRRKL